MFKNKLNLHKTLLSGKDLSDFHFALLGFGVSNKSALSFLREKKAKVSLIASNPPEKEYSDYVEFILQSDPAAVEVLSYVNYIILSPGIPRDVEVLCKAHDKGVPIISELELVLPLFKNLPMIAVTGSNGKTTTVNIISEIIKNSGYECILAGNVGTPLCEFALKAEEYDYVVLELSSFQLESTPSLAPNAASILNLFPNHGERYQEFDDYAKAKAKIADKMDEYGLLIIDENDAHITNHLNTKAFIKNIDNKIEKFDLSDLKMIGEHNRENLWVAINLLGHLIGDFEDGIQKTINEFRGIEHRLEWIPFKNRYIYNDAKSTNWLATQAAVKAIRELPGNKYLILGGHARGKDDLPPQEAIDLIKTVVNRIYLMGEMGFQLEKFLQIHGIDSVRFDKMDEVVDEIMKEMEDNDVLLLSPAAPSFDQFQSYADRGNRFKQLIKSKK